MPRPHYALRFPTVHDIRELPEEVLGGIPRLALLASIPPFVPPLECFVGRVYYFLPRALLQKLDDEVGLATLVPEVWAIDWQLAADPSRQGGNLKPSTVRNVLQREVLAALESKFPACGDNPGIVAGRLHSFRHFFCSWSADNGVSEQMLMSWLGHRDSEMIRHYYHMQQDEAHRQMDKMTLTEKKSDPEDPASVPEDE